jgi:1,4-dihydroxy-2-naphthoate polyprenyltransferase
MASRPPTLTAAIAPVVVGSAVAYVEDGFHLGIALAALIGALALQVGANFANDVFDFKRGADTGERLGPPRATQMGLLSPREVLTGMWVAFAVATVAGIILTLAAGWVVIAVGVASILAAIIYTGGPWPIGYHALGDVFTFTFFGIVAVVGTTFVQTGTFPALAWAAAIPLGCTVTAILVVNNLRDIETDRTAGKTTLAVVMGDRVTRRWFITLVVIAYATVPLSDIAGASPLVLVAALSLPWAVPPLRAIRGGVSGRALNPVLKQTAQFHLFFGLFFALGMVLGEHWG